MLSFIHPSDSIMSTTNTTSNTRTAVENLLGCKIKCTLSDGRTATGRFVCLDRMRNIILTDCVEERWIEAADFNPAITNDLGKHIIRHLQQAMVPGSSLQKVEISKSLYESKVQQPPLKNAPTKI